MMLRQIEVESTKTLSARQKIETEIGHIQLDKILKEIENWKETIAFLEQSIRGKEGQEQRMKSSINGIRAKIVSFNQQLHQVSCSNLNSKFIANIFTL